MKRSLVNIAMALCIGLFAACSQEEITTSLNGEVETVSIDAQLPQTVGTRALPEAADDHQLRCILEVWDKAGNGTLITRIEKLATAATDGKLQFTFSVGKDVNYQCLLWADFIASDASTSSAEGGNTTYADKYFTTTNLKAIDFKATDATLFNNPSSDAFCGAVDKNGTTAQLSVTLKRPFTKVTLTDNSEYIDDCTGLEVAYNTPSGYNIATGIATTTKAVNATGLTINGKTWFSTYIFASTDMKTLDQDITMTVTKESGTETRKIKGGQISLDANKENNANANFSDDVDVDVDVDIDGEYPDPDALKIGQFVNKDGTVEDAYDAEKAVGIVFAAAKGKTDTSNYGEGKTIAGYAMALTSVGRSYLGSSATEPATLPTLTSNGTTPYEVGDYNGFAYSSAVEEVLGQITKSILVTAYTKWKTDNTFTGTNLSAWYIPSGTQIKDISSMLFGYKEGTSIDETVKSNDFITAYNTVVTNNAKAVFDLGGTTTSWIMSSYITPLKDVNSLAAIVTDRQTTILSAAATTPTWAPNSRFVIRPVLTIFK